MSVFDDESLFGSKPKKPATHEMGAGLDDLSADELGERIELLRAEIARLEQAIDARRATQAAAAAAFKV